MPSSLVPRVRKRIEEAWKTTFCATGSEFRSLKSSGFLPFRLSPSVMHRPKRDRQSVSVPRVVMVLQLRVPLVPVRGLLVGVGGAEQ